MLTLADVSKAYGTRTLFSEVSLFVGRTDRFGLVGANGAGKTTLLNLILGHEAPDEGSVTWERGADFGHLPQETAPAGDETVLQLAMGPAPHPDDHAHDIDYSAEPRAKQILAGLGFRQGDFERRAASFSGGWVMRAHIARLLVSRPSLLLLDEPTNHLDLDSLLWFQDHLINYPGGLIVISHDRAFLNTLCTGILELRAGELNRYTGNYDDYLRQKDERHAQQAARFKNQQREIAHLQSFVDRFGAKASLASRAKSKEKQIERLREEAVEEPMEELKRIRFRFPQPPRSGLKVMGLNQVEQAYGEHVVYRGLDFETQRGDRIVLVGPNGAGKSTLLKVLAGVVPIRAGSRELGSNVRAGYFAQNRLDNLDPSRTVYEEALSAREENPDATEQMVRAILGGMLFRKDDVHKKVSVLSGGEKSRLALAKLLLAPPNLLLMDEPTTHLDIPSTDALIEALKAYEGTLIFISHDVYFIRQIARTVVHVQDGRLTPYAGGYDYYVEKSRASGERAALTAGSAPTRSAAPPQRRENRKDMSRQRTERAASLRKFKAQVAEAEKEVAYLEKQQADLTGALESPETYQQPGRPQQLNRELSFVVDQLAAATSRWEEAVRALDSAQKAD